MDQKAKRKRGRSRCGDSYADLDSFAVRPGFNIEGRDRFRTGCGASCSLFLLLLVLIYGITSFWILKLTKEGAGLVATDFEFGGAKDMHVK